MLLWISYSLKNNIIKFFLKIINWFTFLNCKILKYENPFYCILIIWFYQHDWTILINKIVCLFLYNLNWLFIFIISNLINFSNIIFFIKANKQFILATAKIQWNSCFLYDLLITAEVNFPQYHISSTQSILLKHLYLHFLIQYSLYFLLIFLWVVCWLIHRKVEDFL